jgi:LmbE family N-acetylglucosaminyl deacetylase
MKYVMKFLLSLAVIGVFGPFNQEVYAEETVKKPIAVFYSPHQDDELLTMGHAITRYVQEGYEVHVVLLTDGSKSSAIHSVNREMIKHYLQPLTTKDFSYARNLEFVRSLKSLGVKRENIHMAYLKDGETTVNKIEEVMLKFQTRYPEAKHMAFSYYDDHIDHKNSGIALLSLYNNGLIQEPKFYIQNRERHLWDGVFEPYFSSYDLPIQNAMIPYLAWNPLRKMYSIGAISVYGDFELLKRDPRSKYHGPRQ